MGCSASVATTDAGGSSAKGARQPNAKLKPGEKPAHSVEEITAVDVGEEEDDDDDIGVTPPGPASEQRNPKSAFNFISMPSNSADEAARTAAAVERSMTLVPVTQSFSVEEITDEDLDNANASPRVPKMSEAVLKKYQAQKELLTDLPISFESKKHYFPAQSDAGDAFKTPRRTLSAPELSERSDRDKNSPFPSVAGSPGREEVQENAAAFPTIKPRRQRISKAESTGHLPMIDSKAEPVRVAAMALDQKRMRDEFDRNSRFKHKPR